MRWDTWVTDTGTVIEIEKLRRHVDRERHRKRPRCRVTAEARIKQLGVEFADTCVHAEEGSWCWERALVPHPRIGLPGRPTGDDALPHWQGVNLEVLAAHSLLEETNETVEYPLDGDVYSDASGCYPKCPHRRRIAFSAVVMREGRPHACVSSPLDYPMQSVVADELEASAIAARYSPPHALNHVDCEAIIKGAKRGKAWCTDPTRPYADLWREWWHAHRQKR